jgi:hypothetical protein
MTCTRALGLQSGNLALSGCTVSKTSDCVPSLQSLVKYELTTVDRQRTCLGVPASTCLLDR